MAVGGLWPESRAAPSCHSGRHPSTEGGGIQGAGLAGELGTLGGGATEQRREHQLKHYKYLRAEILNNIKGGGAGCQPPFFREMKVLE